MGTPWLARFGQIVRAFERVFGRCLTVGASAPRVARHQRIARGRRNTPRPTRRTRHQLEPQLIGSNRTNAAHLTALMCSRRRVGARVAFSCRRSDTSDDAASPSEQKHSSGTPARAVTMTGAHALGHRCRPPFPSTKAPRSRGRSAKPGISPNTRWPGYRKGVRRRAVGNPDCRGSSR